MAHHGAASDAHPPVARVFVFDDRLGRGEGAEHEKLLGVFPSSTARDECAAAVGLAQGLTGFLAPFADARAETPRRAREVASSSTEKKPYAEPSPRRSLVLAADARRVACLECEPHIWWLLSVDARAAPERDVRDHALLRMLADAHEDYELVHGSVQSALSGVTPSASLGERGDGETNGVSPRVSLARRRLAPFVASLGSSLVDDARFSSTFFLTEETRRLQKRATTNALTHAREREPVALANHADPSAFVCLSVDAERREENEKNRGGDADRTRDSSPNARLVASRVLDTVASALRRRGASVAASAAVYRAADGSSRAASASSRAMARFADGFFFSRREKYASFRFAPFRCRVATEESSGSSARDAARSTKKNSRDLCDDDASIDAHSCASRIGLEAESALAALRGFGLGSEKTGPAAATADDDDDEKKSDADAFFSVPDETSRVVSDEDEETFFFALADADPNRGVAAVRVADRDRGDAATFAWTLSSNDDRPDDRPDDRRARAWRETIANEISKLQNVEDVAANDATTDVAPPSSKKESRILRASLVSFRALHDEERRATARAMDAGAFQPHAFVAGDKNERLTVGCVACAYPEDDNRQKQNRTFLSSATTRFASSARAELDAFRRERDRDEFPNESCHRASHDAWVAFRGADFFSKELEKKKDADADGKIGSFVVSVAEGSSATLLEASARADACLRQAAYF